MSARPIAVGKMAAPASSARSSLPAPAQPEGFQSAVLWKLVLFSVLMAVVPIGTYFTSLSYMWKGNTTPAAISAVLAANIVLVGYVVVAFREDAGDRKAAAAAGAPGARVEGKKHQ